MAHKDINISEQPDEQNRGHDEGFSLDRDDVESIKKELEEEKAKALKYLANWQRAEADFINYKKRVEQERVELNDYANAELIKNLLTVVDDLERALKNIPCGQEEALWLDGVKLVYRKLLSVLEAQGVSQIVCEGEDFNPNVHEAVMCVPGDEGKIVEEIQKGYLLRNRVLRPSMCKVGKKNDKG